MLNVLLAIFLITYSSVTAIMYIILSFEVRFVKCGQCISRRFNMDSLSSLYFLHYIKTCSSSSVTLHTSHSLFSTGVLVYLPFSICNLWQLTLNLHNARLCSLSLHKVCNIFLTWLWKVQTSFKKQLLLTQLGC